MNLSLTHHCICRSEQKKELDLKFQQPADSVPLVHCHPKEKVLHGGQFDVGERQKWTKIQFCNCSPAGGRLGEASPHPVATRPSPKKRQIFDALPLKLATVYDERRPLVLSHLQKKRLGPDP